MGSLRRAFFVGERMTESRKIQLEAEMSTAGVKQGAQDIKATVSDMANAVSQEASRAGQAVGKIGDGGEQTSQKVDRTTKSMIQSIQRVTAQMEAGSRTSAKYYETLAQQRGVDVNALRPYLDQLDDVSKKQSMASGALAAGAVQFDKYGMSAKQTAAAMRGVPAQLTDIVVSLQSGQQPMTVLLQQGGQLKDMFGGIAPAARALGGAVLGIVNPFTLAAGAAVGLYAAYRMGAGETEAFNKTLITTGNQAGLTADQLNSMAQRLGAGITTQRNAASALNELAGSGRIAARNFEEFAVAAIRWEQATGSAVADTVKHFENLGKAPVEASLKLNESMNYLTASTYEQIKALEDAGRGTDAASLAQKSFAEAINQRTPGILEQVGSIERAWNAVKGAVTGAISAMGNIGRPDTVQSLNEQLQAKLQQLNDMRSAGGFAETGGGAAVGGTRGRSAAAQGAIGQAAQQLAAEIQMLQQQMTAAQIEVARKNELDRAVFRDTYAGDSSRQTQAQQRASAIKAEQDAFRKAIAGLATDSKEYERIYAAHKTALLNIDKQYEEKKQSGGGISTTQTELARLQGLIEIERQREELLRSITGTQGNLNEGEKLAIQYGEKLKLVTDEKTIAQLQANKALAEEFGARKRSNDEMEKWRKSQESTIDSVTKQTRSLRDQIETYGMGRSAIEEMTIARLEEQIALAESKPGQEAAVEGLKRELAARRELLGAMRTKEGLDAQLKEWQNWEREVDRIFDQLGQSLTDQLFEGGKSARDMLKDMFRALTLRVVVQPMLSGLQGMVTQQVGGLLGYQNPASGNGLMDAAGGLKSTYDAFSGGLNQTLGNGIGWVGEKLGSSALQSFASGLSGTAWTASTPMFALSSALPATATWAGTAAGLAGTAAAVPSLAGVAAGPGLAASLGTSVGTAGAAASAGAAGIGTAIGAALPWIGGALAIGSLLGGSDLFGGGPPKTRHGQRSTSEWIDGRIQLTGMDSRQSSESQAAAAQAAQAAVTQANEMFARLGVDAAIESFYAIMESSVLGDRQGVASGGMLRTGDRMRQIGIPQASDMTFGGFGGWSSAEMLPRLATDIQLTVLEAFQQIGADGGLPDVLYEMVEGVFIRGLDESAAQQLAQRFSALTEGALAFMQAADVMPHLQAVSFDAAAGLVQLAGGVESLMAAEQSYYQNFYTEAERHGHAVDQLTKALAGAGIQMPELVGSVDEMLASYRALVDAQDVNTEAGRQARWALIQASGAFAEVANYAGQADAAMGGVASSMQSMTSMLTGAVEQAYQEVVRLGQQQIAELQKTFGASDTALNAYRSAVQQFESTWGSLIATMDRSMRELRGQVEATAQLQYTEARAVISTALLTGQAPETADLSEAIRVAQQGVTSGRYANAFEERRAMLKLANEMEALKGIAEPELDTARATLEELERQHGRLRGIEDLSGKSLVALEAQVRAALAAEESARYEISIIEQQLEVARQDYEAALGLNTLLSDLPSALRSLAEAMANLKLGGGAAFNAQSYAAANPDLVSYYMQNEAGSGTSLEAWLRQHYNQYGQFEGRTGAPSGAGRSREADYLASNPDVMDAYRQYGSGKSVEDFAREHYEQYGKNEGRSFDVGTAFVPQDMTANIHRGEIIIDPRSSDILRRYGIGVQGGGSDRETVQLLRDQLAEAREQNRYLYEMLKNVKRTANNTEDTANAVGAHSPSEGAVVVY